MTTDKPHIKSIKVLKNNIRKLKKAKKTPFQCSLTTCLLLPIKHSRMKAVRYIAKLKQLVLVMPSPRTFSTLQILRIELRTVTSMIKECPDILPGSVIYKPDFQHSFTKSLVNRIVSLEIQLNDKQKLLICCLIKVRKQRTIMQKNKLAHTNKQQMLFHYNLWMTAIPLEIQRRNTLSFKVSKTLHRFAKSCKGERTTPTLYKAQMDKE